MHNANKAHKTQIRVFHFSTNFSKWTKCFSKVPLKSHSFTTQPFMVFWTGSTGELMLQHTKNIGVKKNFIVPQSKLLLGCDTIRPGQVRCPNCSSCVWLLMTFVVMQRHPKALYKRLEERQTGRQARNAIKLKMSEEGLAITWQNSLFCILQLWGHTREKGVGGGGNNGGKNAKHVFEHRLCMPSEVVQ